MARLRAPRFRGTLFCLAAGVAFAVSPVLIQIAYRHGAAVSGVLAWRYLAAALLLVGLAGRKLLARAGPRRRRCVRARRRRLRARLGALLRLARAHVGPARLARPLRAPRARRRRRRDERPRAPHPPPPLRADGDLRRRRARGRRRHQPGHGRDRHGARLCRRLRRLHPPLRPPPARRRPDGARRLPHGRRRVDVPRRRRAPGLARHGGRPCRPRLPPGRGARRLRLRRQLVPEGRAARRPVDGVAARHGRGAGHDRARRAHPQAAADADPARRCRASSSPRSWGCSCAGVRGAASPPRPRASVGGDDSGRPSAPTCPGSRARESRGP